MNYINEQLNNLRDRIMSKQSEDVRKELVDLINLVVQLIPMDKPQKEKVYPDSRYCNKREIRNITEVGEIVNCIPCAKIRCSTIFGSNLCYYHYESNEDRKNK